MVLKKIIYFTCLFLFFVQTFSQNKVSFRDVNKSNASFDTSFKSYKIVEIDDQIQSLTNGVNLTINYKNDYSFKLLENKILSNDYTVIIKKEDGVVAKSIFDLDFDGKYYRNENTSLNDQIAFSIFENQYTIYIKRFDKEFYIEPLKKFDRNASNNLYVYYEVKDIINDINFNCPIEKEVHDNLNIEKSKFLQPLGGCKTIELNMCVDYSFFITYPSINGVINRNLEILNLSQLNFSIENGLDYDVNFKIKRHYIITCNNCNYWPSTSEIFTNHLAFSEQANYFKMFDYASDIRIFWQSNANGGGSSGTLGLAAMPSTYMCSTTPLVTARQCSIKNTISELGTNLTRFVLSHELGHSLGCDHVNDFNNIMSGTGYTGNTWSSISIEVINNSLTNSNCYYNCQNETCFNKLVENLDVVIESVSKTINLSWLSETDMEYRVRLYNYSTNTWTNYTTVLYPSSSTTYNYNFDSQSCSYKYKIEITPVCSGVSGVTQILVINMPEISSPNLSFTSTIQNENICSGEENTFTVSAQYPGTNPVYQWKINNINVGENSPNFTTSDLQNNDVLSCDITSDELCLLSSFSTISKVVTVVPQPCGNLSNNQFENDFIDFFPNPVKSLFQINSRNSMKNISIFNILGQKLFEDNIDKTYTQIDLSFLPTSSYFVKIEFDNSTQVIKIIKE